MDDDVKKGAVSRTAVSRSGEVDRGSRGPAEIPLRCPYPNGGCSGAGRRSTTQDSGEEAPEAWPRTP